MLKSQLEDQLKDAWAKTKKLEGEIQEQKDASEAKRKALSSMLGKTVVSFYDSDKILSWADIYFELGKLTQRANSDRNQIDMQNDIKFLLDCEHQRDKKMQDKKRKERKNEGNN